MTLLAGILFLVQAFLAWHCVRTRRSRSWLWLILFLPLVGSVLYIFTQLLPSLRAEQQQASGVSGASGASGVKEADASNQLHVVKSVDELKERKHKLLATDVAVPGVLQQRLQLGQECMRAQLFVDAQALFAGALQGELKTDPHIQLLLAQALFAQNLFAEARVQLQQLIADNPDFRSPPGHLLYARCLEALHDKSVVEEYEALLSNFPGEEARVRYALYLQSQGDFTRADQLFGESVARSGRASAAYQQSQAAWVTIAQAQLQKPPHNPVH